MIQPQNTNFEILGILNLTPDSFSDGGQYNSIAAATTRFHELLENGASAIDVGAESTRPGANPVSPEEQWHRLEKFLKAIAAANLIHKVSVDTRSQQVMLRAAHLGVTTLNCVGPLPELNALKDIVTVNSKVRFIACHMHGTPETMQLNPLSPSGSLKRVLSYFESEQETLVAAGVPPENIYLDPGLGFGKSDAANWSMIRQIKTWSHSHKIALGLSRKGFIGRSLGIKEPEARDAPCKILEANALIDGCSMIRTHDVKGLRDLLQSMGGIS